MFQRAGTSSGGGGGNVASGTIEPTEWSAQGGGQQTSEVTVSLDFTPKQIYWYAPAASYKTFFVYDEVVNPNKVQGWQYNQWKNVSVGAYSVSGVWNGLKAVPSGNSFTLVGYDNGYTNTTIYYTAIG